MKIPPIKVLENSDQIAAAIFSNLVEEDYNVEQMAEVMARLGELLVSYAELQDEIIVTLENASTFH
tara:strand:+ start:1158 stop:1355 length:198 start_codon:yes stop_codon:yes gene_type:complete